VVRGGFHLPPCPMLAPRNVSSPFWGLQHCSHERESGLPEEEACPPVTRVGLGETWEEQSGVVVLLPAPGGMPRWCPAPKGSGAALTRVVRDGFPSILRTSAGAVTGSGAQAAPVIVVGGHERAAGGDGCHAVACGLVETCARRGRGAPPVTNAAREGRSPLGLGDDPSRASARDHRWRGRGRGR